MERCMQLKQLHRPVIVIAFYAIGIMVYMQLETWSIEECVYFITVSMTTVGYGDVVPTSDVSRAFTTVYILFGLIIVFGIINDAFTTTVQSIQTAMETTTTDIHNFMELHKSKAMRSILTIVLCILVGAVVYVHLERWNYVEALYFATMTTLTVGYGDLTFVNEKTKYFSCIYIITSVIVVASAIGKFGAIQVEIALEKKRYELLNRQLDLESIIKMDTDKSGGVDRVEFLVEMLVQMSGLDRKKEIEPWLKRFDELDKDGSGVLDSEDVRLFKEEEENKKNNGHSYSGYQSMGAHYADSY